MLLPDSKRQNKCIADKIPANTRITPLSCFFVFIFFIVLTGCDSTTNQGQFELDLFSSVFGDISITQGESTTATVLINRKVDNSEFSHNINMSLIDPPSWLSYRIKENPVKGTTIAIKFEIEQDAKPGIYRLVLYGVGDTKNTVISDSVTFHLVVKEAKHKQEATNANFDIRKKLFSLLKLG